MHVPLLITLYIYTVHALHRFGGRCVIPKLRALSRRKNDDRKIEENVAYATAPGDRLWSQNIFHKEGMGDEEDQVGSEGEGERMPELDYAPNIPSSDQKEVMYCKHDTCILGNYSRLALGIYVHHRHTSLYNYRLLLPIV